MGTVNQKVVRRLFPWGGGLTLLSLRLLWLTLPGPMPTTFSFAREVLKEPALQM